MPVLQSDGYDGRLSLPGYLPGIFFADRIDTVSAVNGNEVMA